MKNPSRISNNKSHTSFPIATNLSHSSCTTIETMGAFGEVRYSNPNLGPSLDDQRLRVQLPIRTSNQGAQYSQPTRNSQQFQMPPVPIDGINLGTIGYNQPRIDPYHDPIYQPTVANSQADSSEHRKKIERLEEVYSTSGDTVEFARNFGDYLNDKIPYTVVIVILLLLCFVAMVFLLVGALNLPFCPVQPMIPIWLMVSGILFILSASFRIYAAFPNPKRKARRLGQPKPKIGCNILCHGLEFVLFIVNIVWLILGCVWVYGSKWWVHFEERIFQDHYCEPGLYWFAFVACTAYLLFFCFVILAFICILCVGSFKESSMPDQKEGFLERS